MYRSTFAIVDERAIWHNVHHIRSLLQPATRLLIAVKANGYGHGAVRVAEAALSAGATDLGVASVEEALSLRKGGIAAPILVLGAVPPQAAQIAATWQITITLTEDWSLLALPRFDPPLHVHLKVDTGMNRLGFRTGAEVVQMLRWMRARTDLQLTGLFTHLATADELSLATATKQIENFNAILAQVAEAGFPVPVIHAANSAATLRKPEWHYDMVRVGITAYGYAPSPHVPLPVEIEPALHFYSFISRVVTVPKGETVGYGGTFTTRRDTRLATLPVGYADGYPRILSNRAQVVVHGQRANVVGTVCMDQMMIDVTDIADVRVGDAVTLYGRHAPREWTGQALDSITERDQEEWLVRTFCATDRADPASPGVSMAINKSNAIRLQASRSKPVLSLDELADVGHTISYELMCALGSRVPRVYVKHYFDRRNS